jgi:ornithine decarboxylase
MVHETTELWAEPGRALVAEASSLLVKVELKKGDALYLNDGSYGSLFDAAHVKWPFPVKAYSGKGPAAADLKGSLKPFRFYGPTCDSIDHMPGPFWLPESINEGDYIEIGMMGAYGVAMATRFNGFGEMDSAVVEDAPMGSMFGLAKRSITSPRVEEDVRKVVRFSRPKGKAGQRRRRK